jgi:hypothetical protein
MQKKQSVKSETKKKAPKKPKKPKKAIDPEKARLKKLSKEKKKKHYVDPKVFQKQILVYYDDDDMTEDLGSAIYNIANRLAFAPNFINYTYREDMVGDAIIKMINALKNKKFNPEKGNPFSYYTKIAFNAFCNRIKKEKRAREAILGHQAEVYDTLMDTGLIPAAKKEGQGTDENY